MPLPAQEPIPIPSQGDLGTPLLLVEHLITTVSIGGRAVAAVADVSFEIRRGETLGLVGESGCGKSLTALSIVRLVAPPARVVSGRIVFDGHDLTSLGESEMREVRGAGIGLIFQEPMTALNPVLTVGYQIAEALVVHGMASPREAKRRAVELLDAVRMPDPSRRARQYPHQLSGGLRQRALIAIALACRPPLVIADEPTTALDATIQAQILDLLRDLKTRYDLSLLLITHDLGVVAQTADRVAVMYAGRIVEEGPVGAVFGSPRHPYTQGLLASIPDATRGTRLTAIPGMVPTPDAIGTGCAFEQRCPQRFAPCTAAVPEAVEVEAGHLVRCYLCSAAPASVTHSGEPPDSGVTGRSDDASPGSASPA